MILNAVDDRLQEGLSPGGLSKKLEGLLRRVVQGALQLLAIRDI
jgi:hypothetical protein